jgi:hypothetical protein
MGVRPPVGWLAMRGSGQELASAEGLWAWRLAAGWVVPWAGIASPHASVSTRCTGESTFTLAERMFTLAECGFAGAGGLGLALVASVPWIGLVLSG